MRLSNAQLAAYSRMFSAEVLKELASRGRSPLFSRLAREAGLSLCGPPTTVASAFEAAFSVLKLSGFRDEYIYKAALTQRVLLGTHSLKTACMLSEFRVGACKADLVILNGTATVYEIKSERDSLTRLSRQLETYCKVFAKVYVIAAERFVEDVLAESDTGVGVLVLSSRLRVQTVREATDGIDRICPLTVFESLRTAEASHVLCTLGIPVPRVPNTALRAELRAIFGELRPPEVHRATVRALKELRSLAALQDLVDSLPVSLAAAALTTPLTQIERRVLAKAVETPFSSALAWT